MFPISTSYNFLVKSHSKCLRKHFLAGCFKVTFWFPKWRSPTGPEKVAYRCKNGNFEEVGWSWLYPDAPRWHIYLHEWLKTMMNVGHFPYMEHLGYKGLLIKTVIPVEKRTILNGNTFIFEGPCFLPNHDYGRKSIPNIVHANFLSSNRGKSIHSVPHRIRVYPCRVDDVYLHLVFVSW